MVVHRGHGDRKVIEIASPILVLINKNALQVIEERPECPDTQELQASKSSCETKTFAKLIKLQEFLDKLDPLVHQVKRVKQFGKASKSNGIIHRYSWN